MKKSTDFTKKYPDLFVVSADDFSDVMEMELEITNICGVPYKRKNDILIPITKIDADVLKVGAPDSLIATLDDIIKRV